MLRGQGAAAHQLGRHCQLPSVVAVSVAINALERKPRFPDQVGNYATLSGTRRASLCRDVSCRQVHCRSARCNDLTGDTHRLNLIKLTPR